MFIFKYFPLTRVRTLGYRSPISINQGKNFFFFFFLNGDTRGLVFKVRTKLRKSVLDPVVVKEYGGNFSFLIGRNASSSTRCEGSKSVRQNHRRSDV